MCKRAILVVFAGLVAGSWPVAAVAQAEKEKAAKAAPAHPSSDELASWIDARFDEIWHSLGIKPEVVDDATFLRRVYLDLVGTVPSVAQARDFLADDSADKRAKLVERLIEDPRCAAHMSRVWRRIMVPAGSPGTFAAAQFEPWLAQQFTTRVPYDEFARRVVTARGNAAMNVPGLVAANSGSSPAAFYAAVGNTPDAIASAVTRIFLGVRIGCAKCHNHPFADWQQDDFWGMAAFFAGMNQNPQANGPAADAKIKTIKGEGDKEYPVRYLWSDGPASIPDDRFPRDELASWMVSKQNPNFSATAVNRVWQQLCGQGLIPQVDDLDLAKSADRSKVLDGLARHFADGGFDLQWLIQGICKSRVYQRKVYEVAKDGQVHVDDSPLAPCRPLKTLSPEQVFDSLEQALMLPIGKGNQAPRYNGQRDQLIARLNEAYAESPDQFRAGIPQTLIMWHGVLVSNATDLNESRTLRAVVEMPFLEPREKIETLFLAAFTRKPDEQELETFLAHVRDQPAKEDRQRAYAEIYWALINSPEFVLCR